MNFLFDALTREECEAIREEDGYERGRLVGEQQGELKGEMKGKLKGKLQGQKEERVRGIHILIEDNLENGKSREEISANLQKRYGLSEDECREYLKDFKEL